MLLQKEIIAKERRAFDLERRLQQSANEVQRLKDERDRLVQISNELRAELNRTKRTVSEYKGLLENLDGGKGGAARSRSGGNHGMPINSGGNPMAHIGKSIFSFDERDQSDSNVIKEDSKESLSDS